MEKIRLCCPCHFGLESVLKFEVGKIGGENIAVSDGRVSFDGDFATVARANICLSSAERVLIEMGSFTTKSFEELFDNVSFLPFENFIGKSDAFPVKGHSLNSKLHSIPDCQRIIKKAVCRRLFEKHGTSVLEESGAIHQITFNILKDVCTIYLDTTGTGLHKRGYRKISNAAPIKETLAAGIVDLARVRSDSLVCDPMCGSGTFLIESAYKALGIAPGLKHSFAAQKWEQIPESVWKKERKEAVQRINSNAKFQTYGFDIDSDAIDLTINNAKKKREYFREFQSESRIYLNLLRQTERLLSAIRRMARECLKLSRLRSFTSEWAKG